MKVPIAGRGLIGGSFALALRDHALTDEIWGAEASDVHAAQAVERGPVDRIVALEEGVSEADLIVLATPADTIPLLAVKVLNRVNERQTVMDTGSIKAELCEVIWQHANRSRFAATHPMWGTEYADPKRPSTGLLSDAASCCANGNGALRTLCGPSKASTGRWALRSWRCRPKNTTCMRHMSGTSRTSAPSPRL